MSNIVSVANKFASEASKLSSPQELAKFGAQRQFFASRNEKATKNFIFNIVLYVRDLSKKRPHRTNFW